MGPVYIAIALVCGYIFASQSPRCRYRYKRSDGWDAYFYVAAWGVVFLVVGWLLSSALSYLGVLHWFAIKLDLEPAEVAKLVPIEQKPISYETLKTGVWITLSLAIAMVCGWISRFRFNDPVTRANWLSQNVRHNAEESLLVYAASTRFPVVVTLSSRKVYIGVVTMPALENGVVEHLELFPLISGYRHSDELTLHITTNYYAHYSRRGLLSPVARPGKLTLNDFRVVIPAREIETTSLFDKDTYNDFKAQEGVDKGTCSMLD